MDNEPSWYAGLCLIPVQSIRIKRIDQKNKRIKKNIVDGIIAMKIPSNVDLSAIMYNAIQYNFLYFSSFRYIGKEDWSSTSKKTRTSCTAWGKGMNWTRWWTKPFLRVGAPSWTVTLRWRISWRTTAISSLRNMWAVFRVFFLFGCLRHVTRFKFKLNNPWRIISRDFSWCLLFIYPISTCLFCPA